MMVTLVLPCYNPPPGWEHTVHAGYLSFLEKVNGDGVELIIVMDGGADGNEGAISFFKQNIPQLTLIKYANNRGKGYAIRKGVAKATGGIIIYTDVDFPYSVGSMATIYNALKNDECDVAMGVKDEAYYSHVPLLRRIISRYLQALTRIFLSMPVTDTQCGLKGFNKSVAPLFLQTTIDRYLFDLEFVRNCFKSKKFRVKAIPVSLNDNVHFRSMDYRILLSESINFIRLLSGRAK